MPTASTTVHKTKNRPTRFIKRSNVDGTTPVSGGSVALSSDNNFVATATFDPSNDRRVLIHGANEGSCVISIGQVDALLVTVTVGPAPDLTKFDLDGFDAEE